VAGTINNFDFDHGNVKSSGGLPGREVLRLEAGGRTVDFVWRSNRVQLRRLVDAGFLGTSSFVNFSFAAWPDASDVELTNFADSVASLCSFVVEQHTGVPILSFLDAEGRVVCRTLRASVQSKYRDECALRVIHGDTGLPQLFRQCFDNHCCMLQTDLWRRLGPLFAAVLDPPYLEQKYATLMMAVELLIRSSLIEAGHLDLSEAESKTLPKLIGMARGLLRWDVPYHYTEEDRYRTIRNAVDHGGALPHDPSVVYADFAKWKLFLLRRVFMRLGYTGQVASPQKGWASSSPVEEFSEEHNSFGAEQTRDGVT
jgi:hypothetical protein